MKKLLLILVLTLSLTLTGCIPEDGDENHEVPEHKHEYVILTEDEIQDLIDAAIETAIEEYHQENGNVDNLSENDIKAWIDAAILELDLEDSITTTFDLSSFEEAVVNMVNNSRDGVLGVINITDSELGLGGTGSGVIYKKEGNTYYMVTNEHVVADYEELTIVYERIHINK